MEMCKTPANWEGSVRAKFEYLARVPDRVVFVPGNGECMQSEWKAKMPHTLETLIDENTTRWLRNLLSEIADGTRGAAFQTMFDNIDEANRVAQQQHLDHDDNRNRLLELIDTFSTRGYTEDFRKRLRANRVGDDEYIASVSGAAAMVLTQISTSWPPELMRMLVDTRAYTLRWLWLRVEAVTHWLAMGGSENANAPSLTNDEIDSQYVVVASYCDELLTKDTRAGQKDERLREALRLEAPWDQGLPVD